ncbi:MAG: thioredoxin domain-containing protein, partial [Archangium sp.]|nr:thioredoxin domain-containing protein [Archangium sp.]
EKMLYDNAQLLHLLAEAWLIAPRPLWKQTAERLVEWLTREMTSSEGTFFAAQDADSEGEEGKFFVWTPAEIRTALGNDADAELICQYFDVTPAGNFEESSSSVLSVSDARIGDARIEALRVKLFEARRKRIAPGLDDKVLAGWNGLTIRGLAMAATAFERDDWAQLAARAAEAFATGTLKRTPVSSIGQSAPSAMSRANAASIAQSAPSAVSPANAPAGEGWGEGVTQPLTAMLEDYGDLISGLVALFQRTQDARWLARAEELADTAYDTFWDAQKSAWRAAPKDASDLVVTPYAVHDNAFPSGASTLTEAQVALTALTGRPRHLERARIYLERMREEALRNPLGFGHLLIAADLLVDGSAELTLIADPERLTAWRTRLAKYWLPTLSVVAHARGARAPAVLDELLAQRGGSGAFLCQHFSCRLPVESDEALEKLVAPFGINPSG